MDDTLNVPTFKNDKDDLKIMKTASLNKKSGTISGKKKLSQKEVLRRIKCTSAAVLISAGINMAGNVVSETSNNIAIRCAANDFYDSAIKPNQHLTDNGQYFYYDYSEIGDYVENMDDKLEGVYYLEENMSAHVDEVLQYTSFENLENAIEASGYKDLDEFMVYYKKQILWNIESDKVKENNSIGGK